MLRAWLGLVALVAIIAIVIFVSAGSVHYLQAWVFLAVFGCAVICITAYLARNDPHLLERRVAAGPGAEREGNQRIIQFVAQIAFLAILVLPGLDHRFGWSSIAPAFSISGDILISLGMAIVFVVFRANTFTSAT